MLLSVTNHQGNPNQNHFEMLPYICEDDLCQKDEDTNQILLKMCTKWNVSTLQVKNQNGTTTTFKNWKLLQKFKIDPPYALTI